MSESKTPVALLPIGARRYELFDGVAGARREVDAAVAATLTPFAYACYRPFPPGPLRARDLLRFGARGIRSDVRTLVGTAIGVGIFGTITPYLTGRIFDAAIPQADRGMLIAFGLALAASAIAVSLFKLVQGVAAVRIQARVEAAIQSAMWDRVLSLPASFFRAYPAGDLADRVGGVDVIQSLISGAGVSAILGAISGLFFVVQMITYNRELAMLAVVLTFIFVGANVLANVWQLRYQRRETELKGSIAGLVLNLITGVSKVRTSGAEPHAFRVWAEAFAQQRRLAYKAGQVQAGATVFSTTFPIVSSMAIFLVMLSQQQAATQAGRPGGARGGATLTTGEFIAFTTAYGLFLAAMQALGDASLSLLRMIPVYERFAPILSTRAGGRWRARVSRPSDRRDRAVARQLPLSRGRAVDPARRVAEDRAGTVRRVRRAVGLRQVDADAPDARLRAADVRGRSTTTARTQLARPAAAAPADGRRAAGEPRASDRDLPQHPRRLVVADD